MFKALLNRENKATLVVGLILAALQLFAYSSGLGIYAEPGQGNLRLVLYLGLGIAVFIGLMLANDGKFNNANPSGAAMIGGAIVFAVAGWVLCVALLLATIGSFLGSRLSRGAPKEAT